jgi:endonuclease-3 related protein
MKLLGMYNNLLNSFGRQRWWPAKTRFEIIVGAILTQQTMWRSVEKAIARLMDKDLLDPISLSRAKYEEVEDLIRPTRFYRQKARRIIRFSRWLLEKYDASLDRFFDRPTSEIREELLTLEGIGPETADSILLFAGNRLIFPIDAYTKQISRRLGIQVKGYEGLQIFFQEKLPKDLETYKELRALIVTLGKNNCGSTPKCEDCPLQDGCNYSKT